METLPKLQMSINPRDNEKCPENFLCLGAITHLPLTKNF